jgi:hypothetical protein
MNFSFFIFIHWTFNTNGAEIFYVNGQVVWNISASYPSVLVRQNAYLGRSAYAIAASNGDAPFNGYMNEFRVYNAVLPPSDVYNLYAYKAPAIAEVQPTPTPTPPLPITNLSGTAGIGSANLSWSAVSNASSYSVYVNGVGTISTPATSATVSLLGYGTTYTFTAYALNSGGALIHLFQIQYH